MNILLDTTVLIDVLRNRNSRRKSLAQLVEQGHTLATSAINIGEVFSGMRPAESAQTAAFLDSLECFPVTAKIARSAGSLKYHSGAKGITLSLADMIVAATALEYSLILMTDNDKHFPIDSLSIYTVK